MLSQATPPKPPCIDTQGSYNSVTRYSTSSSLSVNRSITFTHAQQSTALKFHSCFELIYVCKRYSNITFMRTQGSYNFVPRRGPRVGKLMRDTWQLNCSYPGYLYLARRQLHLTIQMMQMIHIAFLASPPPRNHKNSPPTQPQKPYFPTPLSTPHFRVYVVLSRTPYFSLRFPNTTQLAPSTKAGFRNVSDSRF